MSIHLVSYEGRPRPETTPPQPAKQQVGPLVWHGKTDTNYWVGSSIIKSPEDITQIELSHQHPRQGEVDIQLHIGAEAEVPTTQLEEIAFSISVLSYLNIALGELLVPVAPIQIRTLQEGSKSQFDNPVSVLVWERKQFTPEILRTALNERFRTASHRMPLKESAYESEGRRFESCRAR